MINSGGTFRSTAMKKQGAVALLAFVMMVGAVWAQTTSGSMAGTVKDTSGAVIPNATVTIVNEQTGAIFTAKTNATGDVLISNVPFGVYDITASAPGFSKYTLKAFRIDVGKSSTATLTLPIQSTSVVEVSAVAAVPLDTTTTNLTQTFENRELSVLPTTSVGLGVLNASLLSPGVAS